MNSKEYWNSVSETKQFTTPFQFKQFEKYVKPSSLILDMGCGYGRTLHELYQRGYCRLIGIGFSEGMISRGHSLFPELDLRVKNQPVHRYGNAFCGRCDSFCCFDLHYF